MGILRILLLELGDEGRLYPEENENWVALIIVAHSGTSISHRFNYSVICLVLFRVFSSLRVYLMVLICNPQPFHFLENVASLVVTRKYIVEICLCLQLLLRWTSFRCIYFIPKLVFSLKIWPMTGLVLLSFNVPFVQ